MAGQFLMVWQIVWTDVGTAGIIAHVDILVNGVIVATTTTGSVTTPWAGSGTVLQRLAAGDFVGVTPTNDFIGGDDATITVSLSIVKVAD